MIWEIHLSVKISILQKKVSKSQLYLATTAPRLLPIFCPQATPDTKYQTFLLLTVPELLSISPLFQNLLLPSWFIKNPVYPVRPWSSLTKPASLRCYSWDHLRVTCHTSTLHCRTKDSKHKQWSSPPHIPKERSQSKKRWASPEALKAPTLPRMTPLLYTAQDTHRWKPGSS